VDFEKGFACCLADLFVQALAKFDDLFDAEFLEVGEICAGLIPQYAVSRLLDGAGIFPLCGPQILLLTTDIELPKFGAIRLYQDEQTLEIRDFVGFVTWFEIANLNV